MVFAVTPVTVFEKSLYIWYFTVSSVFLTIFVTDQSVT